MDKVERVAYLDVRNSNETAKRAISAVLKAYVDLRIVQQMDAASSSFYEDTVQAVKNALFLKYTGIEFEAIFQSIFIDKKIDTLKGI